MKGIEFIKKNISVLNVIALIVFIISLFKILTIKSEDSGHGIKFFLLTLFIIFSFLLLILDFIIKIIIKNVSIKTLIKLIIYPIIFILLIYFIYIILS